MIDGTLYVSAQNGVFALDPLTGAQQWKFETSGATRRGLAYWPGDAKTGGRLLISSDTKLLALDMKTGKLTQEFGQGGFVEMGVSMDSPASVYKDVLITPAATPIIRAWNARTGALLWTFNLIAQPGDPNHSTWENDAWKTIGGTNTWGYLSIDEERGIVYIPVSIAGGDYVGVERPGNNLYGTSLVAVDIATGNADGISSWCTTTCGTSTLARRRRCLMPSRTASESRPWRRSPRWGCLFIFDRVTGTPIFGIEERAVPQSTVPGEKTSPTQPFTVKPPPWLATR
jgi:quinoprotein glucose dehydrogenase